MCQMGQTHSDRQWQAVVISVLRVDYCLLAPYSCWEWDVGPAPERLISGNVQPKGLYLICTPARPSLCPLFECFLDLWKGSIESPPYFAGMEKGLLFGAQHGGCVLLTTVWVVFRSWTLRASWNFTPPRASISSSSLLLIWGTTASRKALGRSPGSSVGLVLAYHSEPWIRWGCIKVSEVAYHTAFHYHLTIVLM